jgi:hypothetical protein
MKTIKHGKMLLKESQKLHGNKYGSYFGYSALSQVFKNVTEITPSMVLENCTDILCRNFSKKLPIYDA